MGPYDMPHRDEELVEMRFSVPRDVFNVVDAVRKARRLPINRLAPMILREWAEEIKHQSNLVLALTRGNGTVSRPEWDEDDDPNGG